MTETTPQQKEIDPVIMRRVLVKGTFVLKSVAHFGGGNSEVADMTLTRGADGSLLIPGSSIAGACRSYLAYRLLGKEAFDYVDGIKVLAERDDQILREYELKRREHKVNISWLFGTGLDEKLSDTENDYLLRREGWQSALLFSDAYVLEESGPPEIRDGVRIDAKTGQVFIDQKKGAKYDLETVPAGTTFEICLELVIRKYVAERNLRELLNLILEGFKQGEILLGARTRRGLGWGEVADWLVQDFDFSLAGHLQNWLYRKDTWVAWTSWAKGLGKLPTIKASYCNFTINFKIEDSLLIRRYSDKDGEPDAVMRKSGNDWVIPATSAAGVLRHRAARILRTLAGAGQDDKVDKKLAALFGMVETKQDKKEQRAGRLIVQESTLDGVDAEVHTRVRIDRFTGGALSNYLFEEMPVWGSSAKPGSWTLRFRILEPAEWEIALLLHLVKDLWMGDLTIGGEGGIGRGKMRGKQAEICWRKADGELLKWEFEEAAGKLSLNQEQAQTLNEYAAKLAELEVAHGS